MEGDFQYPASGLSRWLQWLWRGIRAVAACVCPLWVLQPQFFIASVRAGADAGFHAALYELRRTRKAPRYDLLT